MRRTVKISLQRFWPREAAAHCVLVYHSVSCAPYSVHPTAFRQQMEILQQFYHVVPLPELLTRRQSKSHRCAAVTFDDGFEDNYTTAWPVLCSLGISPTLFVMTSFVGERHNTCEWSPHYRGARSMTWEQVAAMASEGATVGAHTRTHPRLADCTAPECAEELSASRLEIAQRIGLPADLLAYPFGQPHDFTAATRAAASRVGYRYAFTTLQRTMRRQDGPFALPASP